MLFPLPILVSEDVKRTDKGMGFQWRRLDLKAQFGPEIRNEVNVGGNFGLLYSRWVF